MGKLNLWLKILSIFVLFGVLFSANNHRIRTYIPNKEYTTITPDSIFYLPKRITEKLQVGFLVGSNNRNNFEYHLLDKRLIELKILVTENKIDDVITATQRYSAQVAKVSTDRIHLDKHIELLKSLQSKFIYDSAYWLSIQHAINTIEIIHGKI